MHLMPYQLSQTRTQKSRGLSGICFVRISR